MAYQDSYTREAIETDADLAEDELNRIVALKRDAVALFDNMRRLTSAIEVDALEGTFEQEFDDALHHDWYRLARISGSVEFDKGIPSLADLRVKMIRDAEIARQNRKASTDYFPRTVIGADQLDKLNRMTMGTL